MKSTPEEASSFSARLRNFRSSNEKGARRWSNELYSFGMRLGIEEHREQTDFAMRDAIYPLSLAIIDHTGKFPTVSTFELNGKPHYRNTYQADLDQARTGITINGDYLELAALMAYNDFLRSRFRFMNIFEGTEVQNGISIHGSSHGKRVSLDIGSTPSRSFARFSTPDVKDHRPYPDIFPLSFSGIPDRLAQRYPESEHARQDMVRDIARGSAHELVLTSRAHAVVTEALGVEIERPTRLDSLLHHWRTMQKAADDPAAWEKLLGSKKIK